MQYYLNIQENNYVKYTPVLLQEYINFEGLGIFQDINKNVENFSYGRLICKDLEKYLHLFPPEKEIILNQYDDENNVKPIKLIITGIVKPNKYYYIYVKGV